MTFLNKYQVAERLQVTTGSVSNFVSALNS